MTYLMLLPLFIVVQERCCQTEPIWSRINRYFEPTYNSYLTVRVLRQRYNWVVFCCGIFSKENTHNELGLSTLIARLALWFTSLSVPWTRCQISFTCWSSGEEYHRQLNKICFRSCRTNKQRDLYQHDISVSCNAWSPSRDSYSTCME